MSIQDIYDVAGAVCKLSPGEYEGKGLGLRIQVCLTAEDDQCYGQQKVRY